MRQREAFHFIHRWCQNTVKSKKTGTLPDPFHIFISGGAGTWKSHLIRAIYHMCVKTLRQAGDDPSLIPVLLTSPTGTAAFNIGGMTLHSAFHLDFGRGETKLSDDKRYTLRTNLSALRIVVIDEISIVGISLFNNLHAEEYHRIHEAIWRSVHSGTRRSLPTSSSWTELYIQATKC